MTFSDLLTYFDFTSLDKKRSMQLSKEFPYILVDKENNNFRISLGPHDTFIDGTSLDTESPVFKCSCVHFEKRGFCHHLHFLIDLLIKNKTPKVKKVDLPIKKKALPTLKKMLDNADNQLLHSFVMQYGRKHKNFAIVLKARLLRSSTISDNQRNYYIDIINQIIHQRTAPNNPLTLGQLNTFIDVIEIYHEELTSCFEDKDYLNYHYISFAILDRINLVLYRTPAKTSKLLPLWLIAHQHIAELLRRVKAPDLKDEILSSLIDLSSKVYYQYCDNQFNVINLIRKQTSKEQDLKPLAFELINTIKHKENSDWRIGHLSATMQIIFKLNNDELFTSFCQEYLLNSQTYLEIIKSMDSPSDSQLVSKILQIGHNELNSASLHEAYIENNSVNWNKKELYNELYEHLVKYRSINPLTITLFTNLDKSKFSKFIDKKPSLSFEIPAKVYRFLQQPNELLSNLDGVPLGYLNQYDELLWETCSTKINDYYELRINEYLQEYHGNKSIDFISSILQNIQNKASNSEFDQLLQKLSKTFEHRKSVVKMTKQFKRSYF